MRVETGFTEDDQSKLVLVKETIIQFLKNPALNYLPPDLLIVGSSINRLIDIFFENHINSSSSDRTFDIVISHEAMTQVERHKAIQFYRVKKAPFTKSYEMGTTHNPIIHCFFPKAPKEKIIGMIPYLHLKPHAIVKGGNLDNLEFYCSPQQLDAILNKQLVLTPYGEKMEKEDLPTLMALEQKWVNRGFEKSYASHLVYSPPK